MVRPIWFLALALVACSRPAEPEHQAAARVVDLAADRVPGGEAVEDLEGAPGRWHKTGQLGEHQEQRLRELEAIGYASGSQPAVAQVGVILHDPARAQQGLSFYTSGHAPEALLIDMQGEVLHRWQRTAASIWPDAPEARDGIGAQHWRRARLFENGDVVAIFGGLGIARLTRDSEVVWSLHCRAHHDLDVAPDGSIWALGRRLGVRPDVHPTEPVVDDTLLVLSPAGEVLRELSLIDAFRASEFADQAFKLPHGDIFHTNALELLDGRLAERLPAFRAGNVLISLREVDLLAVVDPDAGRVVWVGQGRYRKQHDPHVLADGNLLLFDNLGPGQHSRVLELDPQTGERLWGVGRPREVPFFSPTCGTVARLANGNTLITESDGGRALEVTAERELVWEFRSPHRAGPDQEFVATLFDLVRLPAAFPIEWL